MDDHIIHPFDLLGSVLQVSIHREDHSSLSLSEATLQRWRLTVIATKLDRMHRLILSSQLLDHLPRPVATAIIDENDFVAQPHLSGVSYDTLVELGEALSLVEQGDNHRDVGTLCGDRCERVVISHEVYL